MRGKLARSLLESKALRCSTCTAHPDILYKSWPSVAVRKQQPSIRMATVVLKRLCWSTSPSWNVCGRKSRIRTNAGPRLERSMRMSMIFLTSHSFQRELNLSSLNNTHARSVIWWEQRGKKNSTCRFWVLVSIFLSTKMRAAFESMWLMNLFLHKETDLQLESSIASYKHLLFFL